MFLSKTFRDGGLSSATGTFGPAQHLSFDQKQLSTRWIMKFSYRGLNGPSMRKARLLNGLSPAFSAKIGQISSTEATFIHGVHQDSILGLILFSHCICFHLVPFSRNTMGMFPSTVFYVLHYRKGG